MRAACYGFKHVFSCCRVTEVYLGCWKDIFFSNLDIGDGSARALAVICVDVLLKMTTAVPVYSL